MSDKIVEVALAHSTLSTVVPQSNQHPHPQHSPLKCVNFVTLLLSWPPPSTTSASTLHRNMLVPKDVAVGPRSSSPFHDRERTTTDPGPRSIFCWYHTKFGASAKKCSPPCSFSQQTSSPFVMENLFPNIIPWYQKLKKTLHPDNVQMVTARIQACKLYWSRYN
jgi:hypothetical protein